MRESDVIDRIKAICEARSWTFYRLAKESGITYSTLCTMLHKSTSPSMSTLIKICNGFGISLAEFFDGNNSHAVLSDAQKEHLKLWNSLSAENQMVATNYIRFLLSEQNVKK